MQALQFGCQVGINEWVEAEHLSVDRCQEEDEPPSLEMHGRKELNDDMPPDLERLASDSAKNRSTPEMPELFKEDKIMASSEHNQDEPSLMEDCCGLEDDFFQVSSDASDCTFLFSDFSLRQVPSRPPSPLLADSPPPLECAEGF